MMIKNAGKRMISIILIIAIMLGLCSEISTKKVQAEELVLSNPRIVADDTMEAGQRVTWDCVWFGSYPQAEVITTAMSSNYMSIGSCFLQEDDLIVDDTIYTALKSAAKSSWDANGDITLSDGSRYRRMLQADASYKYEGLRHYKWPDSTTYHYFKYQPIKWRVLSTDGSRALLLSDVALDAQEYNALWVASITWETCTLRSWLNGYGATANNKGTDYSSRNFMDSAFSSAEQAAIIDTDLENADNLDYGISGGNDTTDRLFCLSESEVYSTQTAEKYGFVSDDNIYDEARRAGSSTYAKAMGTRWGIYTINEGNCSWWLRSPGISTNDAACVGSRCYVGCEEVVKNDIGVRVALNLNLSASSDAISSNLYSYAGTVCSDGTDTEIGGEGNPSLSPTPVTAPTVPKVKFLEAKAGKQKLTITWRTVFGVAGYQIEVSTDKNFKGARTVTVSSSKTGIQGYVAKKLKRKKKYYVRVRACKTYNDADNVNQTVYGKWTRVSRKTK